MTGAFFRTWGAAMMHGGKGKGGKKHRMPSGMMMTDEAMASMMGAPKPATPWSSPAPARRKSAKGGAKRKGRSTKGGMAGMGM